MVIRSTAYMMLASFVLVATMSAGALRPGDRPEPLVRSAMTYFASQKVRKLQNDSFALQNTVNIYLNTAKSLDSELKLVISGMNMVDKVAGDLSDFDKALGEVKDLLEVAKLIPPIEEEATTIYEAIAATKPVVDAVPETVNKVNDALTPPRKAIQKFEQKLAQGIAQVEKYENDLDSFVQHVVNAQTCVNDMPSGSVRDGMQSTLDDIAGGSDVAVVDANTF